MTSRIVFIDSNVTDYPTLIPQLPADAEVVVLNSMQDGITQMLATLQGKPAFDAIDIISHGAPGTLMLGTSVLNGENLARTQRSQGQSFIEQLAQLTGADVAASEDFTGNIALGGD